MIVKDPDKVSQFYTEVAGLRREPCEEPNGRTSYTLKDADGNDILGIVDETNFPDWVPGWLPTSKSKTSRSASPASRPPVVPSSNK